MEVMVGNWYGDWIKFNDIKKIKGFITDISIHFFAEYNEQRDILTISHNYKKVIVFSNASTNQAIELINKFLEKVHNYIDVCIHIKYGTSILDCDVEKIMSKRRGLFALCYYDSKR